MSITRETLTGQPYLYVDKECPYGPEIADAMGAGFGEVFGFVGQHGITPQSMPITVYMAMDPSMLRFRAGVMVSAEDAAKASGDVKADVLPEGDVMKTTHTGPYTSLNETHQALWSHMEAEGIPAAMPVWEVYINDPGETPEADLKTDVFRAIA
ncbi:GyrI-like domain-containing protein [Yoonia sp. 208BN28-4]|uniref:GyrI-like domain-containing protein n=1 Tax=Yoonia sp. 208BN28-4 TaxID=3126505 RepID=UPI0030A8CC15